MAEQVEKKGSNAWKLVLGVGLTVLVVLVVTVYALASITISRGKQQLSLLFTQQLQEVESKIPPERFTLLQEINRLAERKENSMAAVTLLVGVGMNSISDRQVSDAEKQDLIQARDFVASRGGKVAISELGAFINAHPTIKAAIEKQNNLPVTIGPSETKATTQTQAK